MGELRLALIGLGNMGKKYALWLTEGIEGGRLSCIVARGENIKWAEKYLKAEIFTSEDELYEKGCFDAVIIVTPHKCHPGMIERALKHGKYVLCDKPAAVSVYNAGPVKEIPGIKAFIFQQRMYRKYKRLKETVSSGMIGNVKRALMFCGRYYRTEFYHRSASWRSSFREEGGGALINQAQHPLDIWNWILGQPDSVYADISFGKYNSFSVDDEAVILMKYRSGLSGTFIISTGEPKGEDVFSISGTKGKLILSGDVLKIWTYSEDSLQYGKRAGCVSTEELGVTYSEEKFPPEGNEPYIRIIRDFFDAVREEKRPSADFEDAYRALEIADAAYLSAWEKREIQIPIDREEFESELIKHYEKKAGKEKE